MEITYSDPAKYPLTKTATLDETVLDLGVGETPLDRIRDLITVTVGYNEEGHYNEIADPFLSDVAKVIRQLSAAQATLGAIAAGSFISTNENTHWASGVVVEGNRIFTPQQAAVNALKEIKERG